VDFAYVNVIGFLCYSAYNVAFYYGTRVKAEYEQKYNQKSLVQLNDVAFSLHALVFSSVTLAQVLYYNGVEYVKNKLSPVIAISTFILWIVTALFSVAIWWVQGGNTDNGDFLNWLNFFYFLSYIKLVITTVKYIPQAWLNWRRRTTIGWSIKQILLDFMGGTLSILQLLLDSWVLGDWTSVLGDIVKFALGLVSILFDVSVSSIITHSHLTKL